MPRPILVAGLGCRRGCPASALRELLDAALAAHGLTAGELSALASSTHKADEAGLRELAAALGLPLALLPAEVLAGYDGRLTRHSARSEALTGSAGVAEASALAEAERRAGSPARLLALALAEELA
jgi:cobalt-precorrin 5A hydrolase